MADAKLCSITGASWCPLSRTKRPVDSSAARWEVEPIHYAMRIYDASHPDNYLGSCQIRVYGDRGWMSSITGAGFYDVLADQVPQILKACGIRTLEGYMTPIHARALRMRLRDKADVAIAHVGRCAGREMPWVVVSEIGKGEVVGGKLDETGV